MEMMPLVYTSLDFLALWLAAIHFGVPLTYYLYLRKRWLPKPWGLRRDPSYTPKVAVIVPTYNEAELIERKLDNVYEQDYPRERMEIIVVDSASTDGTSERVRRWAEKHPDVRLILVEEPVRRGKAYALNEALKHVSQDAEAVVITDADSLWPSSRALAEAVKWFSDSSVGAVSCVKLPESSGIAGVEEGYREFYNVVRVAESKAWATPVFHGELAAFRRSLLEKVGGFPTDIGSDDSHTAARIALLGFRSIIPEDVVCVEAVPVRGYHTWRIRRAQHLVQHFAKTLKEAAKAPSRFKPILYAEAFLHLANPWILLASAILLAASAAMGSILAAAFLALGAALLLFKPYRTWIATQIYLLVASVRNLWTKDLAWEKQPKTGREVNSPRRPGKDPASVHHCADHSLEEVRSICVHLQIQGVEHIEGAGRRPRLLHAGGIRGEEEDRHSERRAEIRSRAVGQQP